MKKMVLVMSCLLSCGVLQVEAMQRVKGLIGKKVNKKAQKKELDFGGFCAAIQSGKVSGLENSVFVGEKREKAGDAWYLVRDNNAAKFLFDHGVPFPEGKALFDVIKNEMLYAYVDHLIAEQNAQDTIDEQERLIIEWKKRKASAALERKE